MSLGRAGEVSDDGKRKEYVEGLSHGHHIQRWQTLRFPPQKNLASEMLLSWIKAKWREGVNIRS